MSRELSIFGAGRQHGNVVGIRPRVVLVNSNQVKPTIAPIAFDYLHEPLAAAGFEVDVLDLCFADDYEEAIARYCRAGRVD